MKTPDEIKKGLECCNDVNGLDCNVCPYAEVNYSLGRYCKTTRNADCLALIRQLEFQNGELLKTVEMLKAEIEEYEESADKCCYESRCNAELNQLEALCKRLRDENEKLEAQVPRWISVKERLPERGVEVLGTNGKEVEMCTYWPGQPTPWESWTQFRFKPTHWMPLPEPPEVKEETP